MTSGSGGSQESRFFQLRAAVGTGGEEEMAGEREAAPRRAEGRGGGATGTASRWSDSVEFAVEVPPADWEGRVSFSFLFNVYFIDLLWLLYQGRKFHKRLTSACANTV
jgi:hypothetical protein